MFWVRLGFRRLFFGFDCDLYVSALLQRYGLAILVLQTIFDANLFVEIIRSFDCNLRFIGHRWNDSRYDFFDLSGKRDRRLFGSFFRLSWLITHRAVSFPYPAGFYVHSNSSYRITEEQKALVAVGSHDPTIESPSAKAIQLLFDGHVSFAQRQTVASSSAPRVTK